MGKFDPSVGVTTRLVLLQEGVEPTGSEWDVIVIESGWSDNGNFYTENALENGAPLFEGVRVNYYQWPGAGPNGQRFFDHLSDRIRSGGFSPGDFPRSLFGTLKGSRYEPPGDDRKHGRILAHLVVEKSGEILAGEIAEAWKSGRRDLYGLSIDAQGRMNEGAAEGRTGRIITSIVRVDSVDVVTSPAAGGRLERLVASNAPGTTGQQEASGMWDQLIAMLRTHGRLKEADASWTPEQQAKAVQEAIGKEHAGLVELLASASVEQMREMGAALAMLQQAVALAKAGPEKLKELTALLEKIVAEYPEPGKYPAKPTEGAKPAAGTPPQSAPASAPATAPPVAPAKAKESTTAVTEADAILADMRQRQAALAKVQEQVEAERQSATIERALAESRLPAPAAARVRRLCEGRKLTQADIAKTVEEERGYIAQFSESGRVTGLGHASVGTEPEERLQAALDGLFEGRDVGVKFNEAASDSSKIDLLESRFENDPSGAVRPYPRWDVADWSGEKVRAFTSIREAYATITGGRSDRVDPHVALAESRGFIPRFVENREKHIAEAREHMRRITESLTVASWAQILGDSITRKMQREYSLDELNKWRWIVSQVSSITDFRTNRRMRMGGYNDLATVAEQATYPLAAINQVLDEEATYAVTKRGLLADLTMEMFANDDVGALRNIPVSLARAAIRTLYKFVFDFLRLNSAIYDAVALANAVHGANIIGTALSFANATTARQIMLEQTRFGLAQETLGEANRPKWLIVPSELEEAAFRIATSNVSIIAAGTSTEPNIHRGLRPIVAAYWTDANDYWFVGDESRQNTIEIGFYQGRQQPELFVQDQETVGSRFTADKTTYKIRHIYGGAVLDFRPFVGGIVA